MRKDINQAIEKLEANGIDPFMINISVSTDLDLSGWLGTAEPSDYITVYHGKIELFLDETFENKKVIGDDPRYEAELNKMYKFILDFEFYHIDKNNKVWAKNFSMQD